MHVHSNTYGILYTLCEVLNEVPTLLCTNNRWTLYTLLQPHRTNNCLSRGGNNNISLVGSISTPLVRKGLIEELKTWKGRKTRVINNSHSILVQFLMAAENRKYTENQSNNSEKRFTKLTQQPNVAVSRKPLENYCQIHPFIINNFNTQPVMYILVTMETCKSYAWSNHYYFMI